MARPQVILLGLTLATSAHGATHFPGESHEDFVCRQTLSWRHCRELAKLCGQKTEMVTIDPCVAAKFIRCWDRGARTVKAARKCLGEDKQ